MQLQQANAWPEYFCVKPLARGHIMQGFELADPTKLEPQSGLETRSGTDSYFSTRSGFRYTSLIAASLCCMVALMQHAQGLAIPESHCAMHLLLPCRTLKPKN